MKYFSMFSGIGTGEKGIEQAYDKFAKTAECVGFSEIDRHAEAIYRYHYPEHRNYGDATAIVPDELPDFDFLISGFPCQSFSIAGKRQGFNDTRGTLFFEIARILSHKRPTHFLLENVRGLLSHDGGKTLHTILGVLSELGYFVELTVLNSKDFGVPQNRERCFFIGHLGGKCGREILSFGNDDGESAKEPKQDEYISACLDASYYKGNSNGFQARSRQTVAEPVVGTPRTHKDGEGFREMKSSVAPALPTQLSTGSHQILDRRIRRLTPVECERLQGLPDGYTAFGRYGDEIREVADTNRYKGLGNAFTVNVIEAIITKMLERGCLK